MKEMSEKNTNRKTPKDEMRAEYDFSGAVRGKYHKRYVESTNVVVLEPDVARRFKNAEAVNEALRSLMASSVVSRAPTRRTTRTLRVRPRPRTGRLAPGSVWRSVPGPLRRDAQTHRRNFTHPAGYIVQAQQLGFGFHVETQNPAIQRQAHFI